MFAITHVDVFDGQTTKANQAILVEGDTIQDILPMDEISLPEQTFNASGLTATAGFIDIQLNGCGGVMLNTDIQKKTLDIMNHTNLKFGTTQYLPTFITSGDHDMRKVLELIGDIENREAEGILGLHLEGPFISREKKGAHDPIHIRHLDEMTAYFLADHADKISVITLAPENTAQSVIDILTNAGITVSLGHTNATYDELEAKSGFHMATHLFNAMSPFGSREPGAVGYIFDKKPYAGIIVDGIHSAFPSVRVAHEILGENLFLITDAVTPAGTDITEYDMAGITAYVTDGKCHYADGTIAGSTITMLDGIRNLIKYVGLSREEALRMATLYPAKALNIDNFYGRLAPGYKANITLLTNTNEIDSVFQMGAKRI